MSELVLFKSRREIGAIENLAAFIAMARDELTIFGADLQFEEMAWDLTKYIPLKAKKGALRAVFSSWETANENAPSPMAASFSSFAKAYFRYQHGLKPTKSIGMRIAAIRALGAACQERGGCSPASADGTVFNRAAQLIGEKFTDTTAYRTGSQLEMLAEFMDVNRLVAVPLQWRNPIPRPRESSGRVGKEFEEKRREKLPSAFELDALARAFRAASEPMELVVTSVAALMCSAPDRVNEVLGLRENCEVFQERPGKEDAFGLRFWPAKGAEPMVKWLIPSMKTVAQEALSRLRAQSAEARRVALWYEENPGAMFLPDELAHLRGCSLSMEELANILFLDGRSSSARGWCKRNSVEIHPRDSVAFSDVESVIIKELPRNFPFLDTETGLRYSEALCITRRNEMHRKKTAFRGVIEAIDQGFIATGLGNRSEHGFPSVFDMLGLFRADGAPISIRSHQFRHYLNTLAQSGGMSELDIAKWSGRKDIRQNAAYNHVSDKDRQARISELRGEAPPATVEHFEKESRLSLVPREQMSELNLLAGHTTEFGFCAHDFAMSPCQLHLDCVNCNEQVCLKGDRKGELNARAAYAETMALLDAARAADADGSFGASQWVAHQELTAQRLGQLLEVLDNPAVPVGAVIQLTHIRPASRLEQAESNRRSLGVEPDETPLLSWQVTKKEPLQ